MAPLQPVTAHRESVPENSKCLRIPTGLQSTSGKYWLRHRSKVTNAQLEPPERFRENYVHNVVRTAGSTFHDAGAWHSPPTPIPQALELDAWTRMDHTSSLSGVVTIVLRFRISMMSPKVQSMDFQKTSMCFTNADKWVKQWQFKSGVTGIAIRKTTIDLKRRG